MPKKKSVVRKVVKSITLPTLKRNEVYKGLIVDENGKPLRHVIELKGDHGSADWDKGREIAKKKGYSLPGKREGALLRASDPSGQSGWFWLDEQFEGGDGCAWAQDYPSSATATRSTSTRAPAAGCASSAASA
jgi:hypothetical protein